MESSFDELLNHVEMNHQLACDPEAGGCGKLNYIHHILSTPPHVFTTGSYKVFERIVTLLLKKGRVFCKKFKIYMVCVLQFWVGRILVRVPRT